MRARAYMPSGHGELVTEPPLNEWADLARRNADAAEGWEFEVAGVPVGEVRAQARKTLLETGATATTRMGLTASPPGPGPVIVTGHQPDLYHAGIWIKDFLVQRIARETDGTGVDVVVDSDSFDWVGMTAPCLDPGISRCRQYLAIGGRDTCYACTPVPSPEHLEDFCNSTSAVLESLPAPAIGRHFAAFCDALRAAAPHSRSLSELVTGARRRFEGDATGYLELPVTEAAQTEPFRRFAVDVLLDAERFALAYNAELAEYRALNRIRSQAQPFPDLEIAESRVEVPFWLLGDNGRVAAYVRSVAAGVELHGENGSVALLPHDADAAVAALGTSGVALVPRAVMLTLFMRTFLADLFIHGIGGDRYDRITDALAERWWGVTLPPFAVASLTMYLPLGAVAVSDEDIAAIDRRLHRLAHNPDEVLGEIAFDSMAEQRSAVALAEEKRSLVAAISEPGADRKELGARIRAVNDQLATLVEPLVETLTARRDALERQRRDAEVLTDRTYPFCLWSPAEVADKVL
jgi:hypothetical protein